MAQIFVRSSQTGARGTAALRRTRSMQDFRICISVRKLKLQRILSGNAQKGAEKTLEQTISAIRPLDEKSMTAARNRFANIAMPLGGLGLLQDAIVQLAGILGQPVPDISRRAAVVFCADNGVVAEGVTQCGQEVTATVAENMGRGESTVCLMAKQLGMDVFPVDIGVARPIKSEKVLQFSVRRGTANLAHEPAMTRKEALEAVEIGIKIAEMCAEKGYSLLIGGEMGIGNTTTSAAVTAALTRRRRLRRSPGRGAGLSTAGLERKIAVIEAALSLHKPDSNDSIDVLHKVGGLDIAGLCGLYLGAAAQRIPVVLDGVISCAAALLAVRLCPLSVHFMVAAHRSDEPASILLLDALGKRPFLTAGMHLGEGTGAAAGVALLDLALAPYREMVSFADIGMEAYQPQK